ncbi:UDP-glucuronosyltransferase [Bacillus sp. FJAT-27225]|uniref:MGDG synthase family glycosyltransferase n=1 Tax=Bacillus sp. FJAT-27225 TaxID=1743144 RepID=UPI00080C2F73|nr:glycosyltransferase [Bacillus sp. FJAT-27225]OCA85723.1 UDP-glucuronosyltransferase [Bacillus sp. FJAT-27225]
MEKGSASKRILFLPFLQIPSGHHQVAKALMDGIQSKHPSVLCEAVDILSYTLGKAENLVSSFYLGWIKRFPRIYSTVYRWNVYSNLEKEKRFWVYERIFLKAMKRLINEKNPDLIVCTHGLPSYLLNHLKASGNLSIPVINVYTDFFIHKVWGKAYIDFHFVPTDDAKKYLIENGIVEDRIYLTGIPVHHKISISGPVLRTNPPKPLTVLVTGGNLGVGAIEELILKIGHTSPNHYLILCGTNKALFQKIKDLNKHNLIPIDYISCRQEMNALYDMADAILTKPGGVTISECIMKRKPIFNYHALPGQEEINLRILKNLGLIYELKPLEYAGKSIDDQLEAFFKDSQLLSKYHGRVNHYIQPILKRDPLAILEEIVFSE